MALCGLSLLAVLFFPIWRIDLDAPQYPEGLTLKIHATGIHGNIDIINGLNHYIGMKTLHNADFPEFSILPYCIVFFAISFLLVAITKSRKIFFGVFSLFVAFGIIAMVDFWKWEYNYGHNLDPHAAIVVPGMAYQPPLIGFKQLLNFGAYSFPDIGGWIFIGCGAIALVGVIIEWRRKISIKKASLIAACFFAVSCLSSCNVEPENIVLGKDNCSFCKMTISDPRFGSEIVTNTGKIFKFDDILCMKHFMQSTQIDWSKNKRIYFADYCGAHGLVPVGESHLLKSSELKCPMNGGLAASANYDSLNILKASLQGAIIKWEEVQ